jgi:hypothetical protein
MKKIKKLLKDFKNNLNWTPIFIIWLFATLVYLMGDSITASGIVLPIFSLGYFINYFILCFIMFGLLVWFFFYMAEETERCRNLELEHQKTDLELFGDFIEKYSKIHYTDLSKENSDSVWKFLSNDNNDEFINTLNEYKKIKFKSKKWNQL